MMWRHVALLTLCLALCAVAAFYFPRGHDPTLNNWNYADLRLLDPADAGQASQDLLAVYLRSNREELDIRLDLLEHAATPDYDLYLALDTRPGGERSLPIDDQTELDWDRLLIIPAAGPMQALDNKMRPVPEVGLRVVRDPVLDQVMLSLNLAGGQGQDPGLQVFVTPAGDDRPADRTDPILAGAPSPPPAQVLLAFWNTYPVYTPATALRRWNGAHTGPLGGSHGLLHLLRAAQAEGSPLALLDLKYPAWLSALDFIGGLGLVQQMAEQGLVILPEYLPDLGPVNENQAQRLEALAERYTQDGEGFRLAPSQMRFTQPAYFPASGDFTVLLADLTQDTTPAGPLEPVEMLPWRGQRMLPIHRSSQQENQAQSDGPSLEARRALSQAALAASEPGGEAVVLVLGGSLPESSWGAPAAARATLHYLKSRPWIHLLNAQGLLATGTAIDPSQAAAQAGTGPDPAHQDSQGLLEALSQAPSNAIGQAAWQAALATHAPVYPAPVEMAALRAGYGGQAWSLLSAARWAEHPAPGASCNADLDLNGRSECVLTTEKFYAQFDVESGALTYLFFRNANGEAHQVIGPSSQVISGLSDPQSWKPGSGLATDPAVIPGAFSESGMGYQPVLTGNEVAFSTADRSSQKIYILQPDGLRLTYRTGQAKTLHIPLLLDPWRRFAPGWSAEYFYNALTGGWMAGFDGDRAGTLQVEIRSNAPLSGQGFMDSSPYITRAENPNQDYPPGFFLPFPLIEVSLDAVPGQDTIVDLTIKN